jgi:hypothetical protein
VEEVTAALMLAHNGYITGQTINVNGGWYMGWCYRVKPLARSESSDL